MTRAKKADSPSKMASAEHLDLAAESSNWTHPAIGSLYRELASCGFTKSECCCVPFFSWMSGLSNGTPLFGDDFRTEWTFYTVFSNSDLATMVPVLQAAASFKRTLPEGYPQQFTKTMATGLSEESREFVLDLIKWFEQIQRAERDAFILWW